MTTPKTFRSPLMAIPATALGAGVGWWIWPYFASGAMAALDAIYRGFPIILYNFLCCVGGLLGGATAFAYIMSLGTWRRVAGLVLIAGSIIALMWSEPHAWDLMQGEGRRVALAVYGLPMVWAGLIGYWGYRMQHGCISPRHCPAEP